MGMPNGPRDNGGKRTLPLSPSLHVPRYPTRGRRTPLGYYKVKDLGNSGQFCRRRQISFSLSCLSISAAKEGFPRGELVPLPGGEGCKVPHIVPPLLSLSRGNAGDDKFRLVPRKNIRAAAIPPITKSIDRIRRRLKRGGNGYRNENRGGPPWLIRKKFRKKGSFRPPPPSPALTKLQPPHVISQRKPKEEDLNSSSSSPVSEAEAAHTKV